MKRHAFTLIELLVVITIIGILATILMPTLSRAKAMAHKAVCINNQKQIGIARQLYATDNEGHLVPLAKIDSLTPPFPDRPSPDPFFTVVNWQDILCDSYLDRNTKIFECPAGARKLAKMFALVRSGYPVRTWLPVDRLEKEWGWGYLSNHGGGGVSIRERIWALMRRLGLLFRSLRMGWLFGIFLVRFGIRMWFHLLG